MAMTEGIGLRRVPQDWGEIRRSLRNASCDSCHTRHTFSLEEAKSPQACKTCHMGFDDPQWEMCSSSKHGVREQLKQMKIKSEASNSPTCQTYHMQEGNHEARTAWGFLAVRLPMPEDRDWAADRATVLQALGELYPGAQTTKMLEVAKRRTWHGWITRRGRWNATKW